MGLTRSQFSWATPSYPQYHSIFSPPKKGLSPGHPYLDLTASLAPKFCRLLTYGVFYLVWTLNHPLIQRVHLKNLELISLNLIKKTFSNTRRFSKVFQPWDVKPPCIVPNHWNVLPVAGYRMLWWLGVSCWISGQHFQDCSDKTGTNISSSFSCMTN